MQPLDQSFISIELSNQQVPCGGSKSIALTLPFDMVDAWEVNLTIPIQTGRIENVQGFYIDTHDLLDDLVIFLPKTQQRIIIPPQRQGYIPALLSDPYECHFKSQAGTGARASVILLNVPLPAFLWETV